MNDIIKCMKLDSLLLKPYLKSILFVLFVPILITFFTGTLFEGLSFAATVMAMTTGYTFSIGEKNNLDRFYGFLPTKKSRLVFGRYLIIFLIGFIALMVTLAVQVFILNFKAIILTVQEISATFILCATLFCIYAGIQIPGYYRFGSIKGKMFMFIPTVGFLLFYYIGRLLFKSWDYVNLNIISNNTIFMISTIGLMAMIIVISSIVSAKIVEKRNYKEG